MPKEGNRQNVLARFDKISQGARKTSTSSKDPSPARLKDIFCRLALGQSGKNCRGRRQRRLRFRSAALGRTRGGKRVAKFPCQRSAHSPRMRRGRTASFTGRLGLIVRSPLAAAEDEWALLLRFVEPPGLRAGPSAHPRSAQPETDRMGAETYYRMRASSAIP